MNFFIHVVRCCRSLNFSGNCLGAVNSGGQAANLGDGQGNSASLPLPSLVSLHSLLTVIDTLLFDSGRNSAATQLDEIRFNFGDIYFGTCRETFEGGNHFRYWKQNTTGAIFMACVAIFSSPLLSELLGVWRSCRA